MDQQPAVPSAAPPAHRPAAAPRVLLGLALVLPAGLALLVSYVVPTLSTFWRSLQDYNLLSSAEWTGVDNYRRILEDERPLGLGFALSTALVPLVILLLAAPLLAWAAARAGRPARLVTRLALTLPMVCFTPTAIYLAWRSAQADESAWGWNMNLGDPAVAAAHLQILLALALFGLVCAIGVTLYLSALRGYGPTWAAAPAVLTVGGLAVISVVAIALQSFTYPLLSNGGPQGVASTPMLAMVDSGLRRLDLGYASAQAVPILIPLMVLGLAAALLVILTGMRVELADGPPPTGGASRPDGARVAAWAILVIGLLAVLAVTAYGLWPWLSRQGWSAAEFAPVSTATLLANTWLPPLISTVVGVGLAAAAGFGIGALRPFGRYSELLLLLFAPWLFVAVGPLFVAKFEYANQLELVGTFVGLIPPTWVVVPALFLFTLLFRGLASQRQARAATGHDPGVPWVLLRSLPMLALVGAATWLVQAQSLLWGYIIGVSPESLTAPGWTHLALSSMGSSAGLEAGEVLPLPVVGIFAVLLGVLHILYLDRLAIRVGRDRTRCRL